MSPSNLLKQGLTLISTIILAGSILTTFSSSIEVSAHNQANKAQTAQAIAQTDKAKTNKDKGKEKKEEVKDLTCPTGQFKAQYFNMDSEDKNGRSKWQTDNLFYNKVLDIKCVDKIDFKAWDNIPFNPKTNGEFFSDRYTGDINLIPGEYNFNLIGDDIAKLYINNNLIGTTTWQDITDWNTTKGGKSFKVTIPQNNNNSNNSTNQTTPTNIRVEHKDGIKAAVLKLTWEKTTPIQPKLDPIKVSETTCFTLKKINAHGMGGKLALVKTSANSTPTTSLCQGLQISDTIYA